MRILWTDEDKTIVKSLFDQGKTYAEIANEMGRTQMSVKQFVQRNRSFFGDSSVKSEKQEFPEHESIKQFWFSGDTIASISEALCIDYTVLKNYINRRRDEFPKRETNGTKRESILSKPKPTPENTVIQYEFKEFDMPPDALMIPFYQVKSGECGFLSGDFWSEPKFDTPCCGLPVFDKRGKGLRRQYCEFHYKISVEEVK